MSMYYIQDSRRYSGNMMLWWRIGGGYTTDMTHAAVFNEDQAKIHQANRDTDKAWCKEYIDQCVRPTVDMQNVNCHLRGML